jgi:hypothetical protein
VVFLGAVTPGNYTIVQVAGDGSLLASAAVTKGQILSYSTTGQVTGGTTIAAAAAGIAKATIGAAGLVRAEISFPFGIL